MVNDTAEPSPYDLEDLEMYQYGNVEEEKNKEVRRQTFPNSSKKQEVV